MQKGRILVIDDETSILRSLEGILSDEGFQVLLAEDGGTGLDIVKSKSPDLVLLDIWLPGMDGIQTLQAIKEFRSDLAVIVMSGHGSIDTAVKATQLGAFDYVEKPLSLDEILQVVNKALEQQRLTQEEREEQEEEDQLIGTPGRLLALHRLITTMARHREPVLLSGEQGTGKELIARFIYQESGTRGVWHKINCALLTGTEQIETLFPTFSESWTLFLDEIDSMKSNVQEYVWECLQRVQGIERIFAASNIPLQTALQKGKIFKPLAELFASEEIVLPPLRERREEIPLLANHFLEVYCRKYGKRTKKFEDEAMAILVNFDWPGNVKELKNIIERIVLTVPVSRIGPKELPMSLCRQVLSTEGSPFEGFESYKEAKRAWEKEFFLYHLQKQHWQVPLAAQTLQMSEQSFRRKLSALDIRLGKFRSVEKRYQRTLKKSVVLYGQGLQSGIKTGLILSPLPPNSGINFVDITSGEIVPATAEFVHSTDFATTLKKGMAMAMTVEHIMAVLHMYRITNLLLKISGEVPIMDGSARDFCRLVEEGGIQEQEEEAEEWYIEAPCIIGEQREDTKYILIEPAEHLSVTYRLHYPPPLGKQEFTFHYQGEEHFKKEIAPARTFGFLRDIEKLHEQGMVGGGRLNNFILIDDEKVLNTQLRFDNEFVRHKILDILGDIYLAGKLVCGKITANMTGHTENVALVKKLLAR